MGEHSGPPVTEAWALALLKDRRMKKGKAGGCSTGRPRKKGSRESGVKAKTGRLL